MTPYLSRRALCSSLGASLGALTVLTLAGPLCASVPRRRPLAFDIRRESNSIGRHTVAFREDDGALNVDIDIEITIKLAFLTLFRYRHSNREVWRDGRLESLRSRTDDDGTPHWVEARATAQGVAVESDGGSWRAPADIVPTSYWNQRTVRQALLLDSQRGGPLAVEIEALGDDTLEGGLSARRYRMGGDLELDLWYSHAGVWTKIAFDARGAQVTYVPRFDVRATEPPT